jgi:hypothetical protein
MSNQPLLADGAELESVVCSDSLRRQHDDGDEQQYGCSCGDCDGTDHGAIKIRSSVAMIKSEGSPRSILP